MYSLDINSYVQQRSLSHKKFHIKIINHLMLIQGIVFNEKICMINMFKNVQDQARKTQ